MFKIAFTSALVAAASAQNIQNLASQASAAVPSNNQALSNLANQANAALAPVLNQENPVVQHNDNIYLDINNYEWTLAEYGNEFEFSVTELAFNNNNLEPGLAGLLANSGEYLQNNSQTIAGLLDAEAANLGITIADQGALASAAQQYGAQLSQNADSIANNANNNYQKSAEDFATNKNGITTQTNKQINDAVNNEQALSTAVSNAIATGLQNSGSLNNINYGSAINANGNIAGLVASATGANFANSLQGQAGQLSSLQSSVGQLGALSNQGINAGSSAALNSNIPSGLVDAAQSVAQNAASGANSAAANNAVNTASSNVQNAANSASSAIKSAPLSAVNNAVSGAFGNQ